MGRNGLAFMYAEPTVNVVQTAKMVVAAPSTTSQATLASNGSQKSVVHAGYRPRDLNLRLQMRDRPCDLKIRGVGEGYVQSLN